MTIQTQINAAEAQNEHTEVVMIKARAMGGPVAEAFLTILEDIDLKHELVGHLTYDLRTMRDLIDNQITSVLKIRKVL